MRSKPDSKQPHFLQLFSGGQLAELRIADGKSVTVCVSGSGAGVDSPVETGQCLGVEKTQFSGANPHCPLHVRLGGQTIRTLSFSLEVRVTSTFRSFLCEMK